MVTLFSADSGSVAVFVVVYLGFVMLRDRLALNAVARLGIVAEFYRVLSWKACVCSVRKVGGSDRLTVYVILAKE